MKIFKQKKVEISNFELQVRYIPQKKAKNMYNSDLARKSVNFWKKKIQFFRFSQHALGPPEIFDVHFFKNFKKNSKNGFTGSYPTLKGTKSWILVNLPQILWKRQTIFDRVGHNAPPPYAWNRVKNLKSCEVVLNLLLQSFHPGPTLKELWRDLESLCQKD